MPKGKGTYGKQVGRPPEPSGYNEGTWYGGPFLIGGQEAEEYKEGGEVDSSGYDFPTYDAGGRTGQYHEGGLAKVASSHGSITQEESDAILSGNSLNEGPFSSKVEALLEGITGGVPPRGGGLEQKVRNMQTNQIPRGVLPEELLQQEMPIMKKGGQLSEDPEYTGGLERVQKPGHIKESGKNTLMWGDMWQSVKNPGKRKKKGKWFPSTEDLKAKKNKKK